MRRRRKSYGLLMIIIVVIGIVAVFFARNYLYISKPIIKTADGKDVSLYIPTNADYQYVKNELISLNVLKSKNAFDWLAKRSNYDENVHPGRYILTDGMTNQQLINMLRMGYQTPVKVVFNNMRTVEQLAGRISDQIEADSISIINEINNNPDVDATTFIPNTYEFYWNTDADDFVDKMIVEHKRFWNETRMQKAKDIRLTPRQVSILASIVDKETTKTSEMPIIAGVYLNRINKRWPLQADPTLVFALGDYNIRRVLDVHKNIDSPYNTYKFAGLPPGPICIPSIAAIDAVLNAEKHNYYYFCAKDDLSGYHVFAKNITEHNRNAEKYRKALNKNKIYK
ncbi:MAG: endolytic transglycosylase MltG [Bacteroidetes bacterium]|nr:endolytic transglycosylase MltG [Bacteroidota bacterium]